MHTNTTGGPTDRPVLHRRPAHYGAEYPHPHDSAHRAARADTERDERLREARERAALIRSTYQDGDHLRPGALDDLTVLVLDAEVARLDAVLTAVRELHKRNPLWDNEAEKAAGYYNTDDMCVECLDDWPCATVQALNEGV